MALGKAKAWVRLIVLVVLVAAAGLVVAKNWGRTANLWLFHSFDNIPVLWLMVVTAVASIVGWWMIGGLRGAYQQVRKTRRSE